MTPKQQSRVLVIKALYQWQISGDELALIEQQCLQHKKVKISKAFFSKLLINIGKNIKILDKLIAPYLEKNINKLGYVERSILYLGTYELKFMQEETPYKVAINEAVQLAKLYGGEGAYKLINKVLDKLYKEKTPI